MFVEVFTQYLMILAFGKNPPTISPFFINDQEVEVVTFFRSGDAADWIHPVYTDFDFAELTQLKYKIIWLFLGICV